MARPADMTSLLRQIALFRDIRVPDLRLIARQMTEASYGTGDIVFHEGEAGDRLFVLLSGTMHVYVERQGKTITYSRLQAGECFGEMALIEDALRSATVQATQSSQCLTLSKSDFLELIRQHPQIALGVMKSLSQRLRRTSTRLQDSAGSNEA